MPTNRGEEMILPQRHRARGEGRTFLCVLWTTVLCIRKAKQLCPEIGVKMILSPRQSAQRESRNFLCVLCASVAMLSVP